MSTPPQPGLGYWYALAIASAVLAFLLAQSRKAHRPVAIFLASMATIDLGRYGLARLVDFANAPRPHVGWVRVAFHLDELGFLAWPAGLAALAIVVCGGRRAWLAGVAWAVVGAALIALYPSELVRQQGLQKVYLAAHLAALLVVIVAVVSWAGRRAGPGPKVRISNVAQPLKHFQEVYKAEQGKWLVPGPEHLVLFLVGFLELARLVPFHGSVFERWGVYVPVLNAILFAVISLVQGVYLWLSSSERS